MNPTQQQSYETYAEYIKPDWAPPNYLFGPVWSVLYVIIFLTYGYVFKEFFQGKIPFMVVLPFILNLFFNFIFTYIQFGLRNNYLASVDILLVLITIVWGMVAIYKYYPTVAYLQVPYLCWVSFATVLQLTITYLNR
jgi:tryptophan-rich sensory protein